MFHLREQDPFAVSNGVAKEISRSQARELFGKANRSILPVPLCPHPLFLAHTVLLKASGRKPPEQFSLSRREDKQSMRFTYGKWDKESSSPFFLCQAKKQSVPPRNIKEIHKAVLFQIASRESLDDVEASLISKAVKCGLWNMLSRSRMLLRCKHRGRCTA